MDGRREDELGDLFLFFPLAFDFDLDLDLDLDLDFAEDGASCGERVFGSERGPVGCDTDAGDDGER